MSDVRLIAKQRYRWVLTGILLLINPFLNGESQPLVNVNRKLIHNTNNAEIRRQYPIEANFLSPICKGVIIPIVWLKLNVVVEKAANRS